MSESAHQDIVVCLALACALLRFVLTMSNNAAFPPRELEPTGKVSIPPRKQGKGAGLTDVPSSRSREVLEMMVQKLSTSNVQSRACWRSCSKLGSKADRQKRVWLQ